MRFDDFKMCLFRWFGVCGDKTNSKNVHPAFRKNTTQMAQIDLQMREAKTSGLRRLAAGHVKEAPSSSRYGIRSSLQCSILPIAPLMLPKHGLLKGRDFERHAFLPATGLNEQKGAACVLCRMWALLARFPCLFFFLLIGCIDPYMWSEGPCALAFKISKFGWCSAD